MQVVKHDPQPVIGNGHSTGLKPAMHVPRVTYRSWLPETLQPSFQRTHQPQPSLDVLSMTEGKAMVECRCFCSECQYNSSGVLAWGLQGIQCGHDSLGRSPDVLKQAHKGHFLYVTQQGLSELRVVTLSLLLPSHQVHPAWHFPGCHGAATACIQANHSKA